MKKNINSLSGKTCVNDFKQSRIEIIKSKTKASQVPIIIDTDLGNDIDDALALILAHILQDDKECRILGVAINKDNPYSPVLVDIINTFYGRGDIEIGDIKGGKTQEDGLFLKEIAEARTGDGYKYKRTYDSYDLDAVSLYRKLLSNAKDNSVVVVSIGFFTNLSRLLLSGPDEYSNLNGLELVSRKVKFLSAMAGSFCSEEENTLAGPEYNVRLDIESAQHVCLNWPTRIVFSGHEVGGQILYPAKSICEDFKWTDCHPMVEGYHLYKEMPYDRPTWDLTSILYAVRPDEDYFDISACGHVLVGEEGITTFQEGTSGQHQYLIVDPQKIEALQKLMVHLCSRIPGIKNLTLSR